MVKRILHVVGGMNRGGTETWLMHVLRHIDRDKYQMDFLVHTATQCAYDDEIRALGSKVIPCLHPLRPLAYARNFKSCLSEHGPYDITHSHVHHFSGFVLLLARLNRVPIRITHSHSDTRALSRSASAKRQAYLGLTGLLVRTFSTCGLAASTEAAEALYGPNWNHRSKWRVLYCGIDLAPFRVTPDRPAVRQELGIPPDAFVVGHVGRFAEPKNHRFLVEIAEKLVEQRADIYFLLVGDGPLRAELERRVNELGFSSRFIFTGARPDVPSLMLGAMDVFLFPSLYEGLGLVLVEAQAAGLPCVVADIVPDEADVVPELITRVSLDDSATVWATLIAEINYDARPTRAQALSRIKDSPFNIAFSVRELEGVYGV